NIKMSSPHHTHLKPEKIGAAIAFITSAVVVGLPLSVANAQDQISPIQGTAILPRDLSPWGMFMNADVIVKAVMIGLVIASVVTWTVWLAKTIELLKARRQVRLALRALSRIQSLTYIEGTNVKEPAASFCFAAIEELRLSDGAMDKVG